MVGDNSNKASYGVPDQAGIAAPCPDWAGLWVSKAAGNRFIHLCYIYKYNHRCVWLEYNMNVVNNKVYLKVLLWASKDQHFIGQSIHCSINKISEINMTKNNTWRMSDDISNVYNHESKTKYKIQWWHTHWANIVEQHNQSKTRLVCTRYWVQV